MFPKRCQKLRPTDLCAFLSRWFLSEAHVEFRAAQSTREPGCTGKLPHRVGVWMMVAGPFLVSALPRSCFSGGLTGGVWVRMCAREAGRPAVQPFLSSLAEPWELSLPSCFVGSFLQWALAVRPQIMQVGVWVCVGASRPSTAVPPFDPIRSAPSLWKEPVPPSRTNLWCFSPVKHTGEPARIEGGWPSLWLPFEVERG